MGAPNILGESWALIGGLEVVISYKYRVTLLAKYPLSSGCWVQGFVLLQHLSTESPTFAPKLANLWTWHTCVNSVTDWGNGVEF